MFGSKYFQFISGTWEHVGYLSTELVHLPLASVNGGVLPKGTWLAPKAPDNDTQAVLASGYAYGFMTQDLSLEGHTSLQSFKDRMIGKTDLPITVGQNVSLRRPNNNAIMEFRGTGTAQPGNLVCTSGTGSLSASSARGVKISFHNGCLRVAQTGDIAQLILLDAETVTIDDVSNLQVRVQRYDAGVV